MAKPAKPDKVVKLKDGRTFDGLIDDANNQIWILVEGVLLPLKRGDEDTVEDKPK